MEDNNDDLTTILAKSNILLYYLDLFKNNCDSPNKIKKLSEKFINEIVRSKHTTLGTLDELIPERYDLILANPPYYQSAVITKESKNVKLSSDNSQAYTANGKGVEGLFTEWIIKSLKYGGSANIVLPDGLFTNIGNNFLKELILEMCDVKSIISLPVGTFFNTPKKTYILTLQKKNKSQVGKKQKQKVFCYICSSIGETLDSYRFDNPDLNDLHVGVSLYNLYKGNEDDLYVQNAIASDPRAKLIDISEFDVDGSWNIDDFWSKDEKIELGIVKKTNYISLEEFQQQISSIISDLNDYEESIKCLKED